MRRIKSIVKSIKFIYLLYYYVGSALVHILKLFVRTKEKLILFVSYGGQKFDDSPRKIYDAMMKDARFKQYQFLWAFTCPECIELPDDCKVRIDSFRFYKAALQARCWVTNSAVERGLNFTGRNTLYFNTWHGTPIKVMGKDIRAHNRSFKGHGKSWVNAFCTQGTFETEIFSRAFSIGMDRMLQCGLPRNDELYKYSYEVREKARKSIGMPMNKQWILYAPTFREYEKDKELNCVLAPPIDLKKWRRVLGDRYVVLFRAHYEVAKVMKLPENDGFFIDVSGYPIINDLMIASDMLISDYSSIFFDYSITEKPMLCFAYDYDRYNKERGLYFDIRNYVKNADNEDDLIMNIQSNWTELADKTCAFRDKFVEAYGSATGQSLDYINKVLNG